MQSLSEENNALKARISELETAQAKQHKEAASLAASNADLASTVQDLKQRLAKSQEHALSAAKATEQAVAEQRAQFQQLEALQGSVADLRTQLQAAQDELAARAAEGGSGDSAALSELTAANEGLKNDLVELQGKLVAADQRMAALVAELRAEQDR